MTPERQRIRIAELQGWKPYSPGDFNPTPRWINSCNRVCTLEELSDYPNSRDALAPVLEGLLEEEHQVFTDILLWICGELITDTEAETLWRIITATPAQLCEAYLRTKIEWEE